MSLVRYYDSKVYLWHAWIATVLQNICSDVLKVYIDNSRQISMSGHAKINTNYMLMLPRQDCCNDRLFKVGSCSSMRKD